MSSRPAQAAGDPPRSRWTAPLRDQGPVVAVVALGGVAGAFARYGAGLLRPTAAGAFPWTTFLVNAAGCAAIGVLMVVVTERLPSPHRLVRPFLGTGVLGGFTTFSTYTVDVQRLLTAGRVGVALLYLAATPVAALLCVWSAAVLTRRVWRT
ncbi:fluoride efflux transporter CrcB [Streptomyces sp. NPDC002574]|uniref:fluoride efflux transporter CrcB n=1 Tax=Streptomyces sp. NPDC002574 TaxID=3364652 RepID=UPI003699BBCA